MAITELYYSLTGKPAKRETIVSKPDADLEKLIDEAGRDDVFNRARSLGWVDEIPPKWVWRCIAHEIISGKKATA